MRQATLVALYGDKPSDLAALITSSQELIAAEFSDLFEPYELRQVHATVIGLERSSGTELTNLNYSLHRGLSRSMDIRGLLSFLASPGHLPLTLQIGGYQRRTYPFTSRGGSPYDRSFSIQGDKAVVMGWPVDGAPLSKAPDSESDLLAESRIYTSAVDDLRRAAQRFGLLHGYHQRPTDLDNDFYFRIGVFRRPLSSSEAASVTERLRAELSSAEPLALEVTLSDLYIVSYEEDALPLHSSRATRVDTFLDHGELASLYG